MKVIKGQNVKAHSESSLTAFEELIEPHQKRIYNYLFRVCGNEFEASQLTQDIFVKAYEKMLSGEDTAGIPAFIYSAAAKIGRQAVCRSEMIS
ncbi:MAG TPA: sigma factor [Clostridia bacterium]|nr:sigma factor [Clostridia bacterium]